MEEKYFFYSGPGKTGPDGQRERMLNGVGVLEGKNKTDNIAALTV